MAHKGKPLKHFENRHITVQKPTCPGFDNRNIIDIIHVFQRINPYITVRDDLSYPVLLNLLTEVRRKAKIQKTDR